MFFLFFPLLVKSSLLKFRSLIFTRCTSFLFGSHSQAGLVSPSLIAISTGKKAAVTWLRIELIPAIKVQLFGRQSLFNKQCLLKPKL